MLNCKQTSQLISQSLDRSLTLRERFALQLHLIVCKYCKRLGQQLQALRVALKQLKESIEKNNTIKMSSQARKRIADLVEANRHNHNT
ncbi:MAG: zf-HC2 domain-containing protein [Methylotenera sp.]